MIRRLVPALSLAASVWLAFPVMSQVTSQPLPPPPGATASPPAATPPATDTPPAAGAPPTAGTTTPPAATPPAPAAAPPAPTMPIPKAGTAPKPGQPAPKVTACPENKVNVNTATLEELRKLPQIGPQRANAIIKARPYAAPEDILKRKVVKKQVFDRIKACIVAPPTST